MSSRGSAPKKQRQSLLFSVKSIFKNSKTHTGAGPAQGSPWGSGAEQPDTLSLPTIHQAVRDNDMLMVDKVLRARPHTLEDTDDRKYCL
jgi:hypothetical protein